MLAVAGPSLAVGGRLLQGWLVSLSGRRGQTPVYFDASTVVILYVSEQLGYNVACRKQRPFEFYFSAMSNHGLPRGVV